MKYIDFLEQKVLLERLVIGLEEPVLIKGLGELSAKIDSGNGGYNVIHGTDFHQQGSELMFTTHDSFGNEKKIQAKVIDTIEVNMGGGNIESRPVIELDIKFAGEDYKKIPFSVSDRSTNSNPILISKGFVEKELEALIDVSAKNISNNGIDVVYGESVLGAIGKGVTGAANAGKSLGKGILGGLKTLGKGISNSGKWLKGGDDVSLLDPVKGAASITKDVVSGIGGALSALGGAAMLKKITSFAKNIGNHDEFLQTDRQRVLQSLSSCNFIKELANNEEVDTDRTVLKLMASGQFGNWQVFPVCNYLCEKSDKREVIEGLQQRRKDYKKLIKKAKEAVSEIKSNKEGESDDKKESTDNNTQPEQQMGESFSLLEALILLEQDEQAQPTIQDTQEPTSEDANENYEGITTSLEQLQNFTLWFIPFGKQYNTENKLATNSKEYMSNFFRKDDSTLIKMFNLGEVSINSSKKVIQEIASQLNKKNKELETSNEYQGFFAIVLGDKRDVTFYESFDCASYVRSKSSIQSEQDANKNKELKQTVIDKLNEIGDFNKEFNLQALDVTAPDDSDYKDVLSIIQSNPNELPMSYKLFNYARIHKDDETVRTQALAKLNSALKTEYPMFLLKQSDLGKKILHLLGKDFKWNGYEDFVNKCLENDQIKELLLPSEQQEEDAWIENKLNHFRNQKII